MNFSLLILIIIELLGVYAYNIQNFTFENYIDHFSSISHTKYKQRYHTVEDYWTKTENSPIILHICGESRCDFPYARLFPLKIAENLGAKYIVLEHRYYGDSQPMPNWSLENLRFLTHDQALADIAYFIESTNSEIYKNNNIHVKWIIIGGSYAGGLAAWFRLKYPHLVYGALASSGVVTPLDDFWMFEKQVVDDFFISGKWCFDILKYYEEIAEQRLFGGNNKERQEFIKLFGGSGLESNEEFMYYFADIHVEFPQYSHREQLCNLLKYLNSSGKPIDEQFQILGQEALKNGTDIRKYTYNWRRNENINTKIASRQWAYQFCTSYGWLQTPSREIPLRWKGMDLKFWYTYCREIFGEVISPKLNHTEAMYGAESISKFGSNIFFTYHLLF